MREIGVSQQTTANFGQMKSMAARIVTFILIFTFYLKLYFWKKILGQELFSDTLRSVQI